MTNKRCGSRKLHDAHKWDHDGAPVWCWGVVADTRDDSVCGCADPLCPCDYKPGWGPYAPAPYTYHLLRETDD